MNKYFCSILLVSLLVISNYSLAQNFFPLATGNKYQFIDDYFYPCSYTQWTKYLAAEIEDSLIYNAEIYYKYRDFKKTYFFKYDSVEQKLFIYDSFFHKKIAADFSLVNGEQFTSYISGIGLVYTSLGESYINIFGQNRLSWTMKYQNPTNNNIEEYTFVNGIGFYKDYLYGLCDPNQYAFHDDSHYLSAVINSQTYNPLAISLTLLTILDDRQIDNFPFYIFISIDLSVPELLDSLYLYYQVVRNGIMIFDHQVPFNPTTYQAIVNLNSTILMVGDSVNLKIVASDSSIFHNRVTLPDSGFYTINVLGDTVSAINSTDNYSYDFYLKQNYPNPFNPTTNIQYSIGSPQFVSLKVYDVLGNQVAILVDEEMPAGMYSVEFNAADLPSGIYFYQLKTDSYISTKKLLLLK